MSVSGEGSLSLFLRNEPVEVTTELDKAVLAALLKIPEVQVVFLALDNSLMLKVPPR